MEPTLAQLGLLAAAGLVAGVVNTMAGGGSLLTLPLLVFLGMPGTIANGTNRVAVLVQGVVGAWRFHAEGVSGFAGSVKFLPPLVTGAAIGALAIAQVTPETFERLFGLVMLAVLVPTLWRPRPVGAGGSWSPLVQTAVMFGIGLYGGAFQAGVGVFLVLALARGGHGLVVANSIKSVVIAAFTAIAVVVFVLKDQVVWLPAMVLSASTAVGAVAGARLAVKGGDALIRPVLAIAVIAMAGRMLGLY